MSEAVQQELDEVIPVGGDFGSPKERRVRLNHSFAQKLLDLPDLHGVTGQSLERCVSPIHVRYLNKAMREGSFNGHITLVGEVHVRDLDRTFRLNGQHTSRAVLAFESPPPIIVRHQSWEVDTMEEARKLYSQYDRGRLRVGSTSQTALLYDTDEFAGISKDGIVLLCRGLAHMLWGGRHLRVGSSHTDQEITHLLSTEYMSLGNRIYSDMGPKSNDTKHMHRSPVYAAMFATYGNNKKRSEEFWHAVKTGTGIDSANDPRLRLRNFLMVNPSKTQGNRTGLYSTEEIYRACVNCWNSWRDGNDVKVVRIPKSRQKVSK